MKKIFLSHATEDKRLVEHIYSVLKQTYPDLDPWLDKYEIVGGDSLIDKIASGIDESEKLLFSYLIHQFKNLGLIKNLKKQ